MKKLLLPIFLTAALLMAQPLQRASAVTLTVNALDDNDDGNCDATHCSLREAIQFAAAGDTIDFSVTGIITLEGSELAIDKTLTIEGPGKRLLTISANLTNPSKKSRVFYIYSPSSILDVSIAGLSISNGSPKSGLGAGIYNDGENLTITNCIISNHTAKDGGGGIYNNGSLNISYSTLSNNTTSGGSGGGIYNTGTLIINKSTLSGNSAANGAGGGVVNYGSMTVNNSTFFDNHADGNRWWGGGIANIGTLTLKWSTLSANSSDMSGGGLGNSDSVFLANTIIANSISGGDCVSDTAITDRGYNLIEDTGINACGLSDGSNGNIIGLDPNLADNLGDRGGSTLTLAILSSSSPAWDAIPDGVNGCSAGISTDQRGALRGGGTARTGYWNCDIGAFEYSSDTSSTVILFYLPYIISH